jgi:4-hydroxysphinganine ceramide fatty acyl 2-hydroxylase
VTIGNNVYDVTDFVDDHPGGSHLILEYAGKDVEKILKDETSHSHSEAAYEVLQDSLVGCVISEKAINNPLPRTNGQIDGAAAANGDVNTQWVHPRTGMSCEEDLSKETDYDKDFQKHQFLDLSKPLFKQVWYGGFSKDFYLDQIHRPRHYKGGQSAPLFGNFLEVFTLTPWWVVPTLWLPAVAYGTYLASHGLSTLELSAYWLFGLGLWTFVEYCLHRFIFHLD